MLDFSIETLKTDPTCIYIHITYIVSQRWEHQEMKKAREQGVGRPQKALDSSRGNVPGGGQRS